MTDGRAVALWLMGCWRMALDCRVLPPAPVLGLKVTLAWDLHQDEDRLYSTELAWGNRSIRRHSVLSARQVESARAPRSLLFTALDHACMTLSVAWEQDVAAQNPRALAL